MTKATVARTLREARNGAPPAARQPMTRLAAVERNATFRAPVTRPGEGTRNERWAATSHCGVWEYVRIDDGASTPWRAEYVPTGQYRETFGTLDDARRATAGWLLGEFRREAFTAAIVDGTVEGHRWLAVHMRHAGDVGAERRCECGGLLVQATRDGKLAHVDACRECLEQGGTVHAGTSCELAGEHRFCGAPSPVGCGHHGDDRRYAVCVLEARPNAGEGCGRGLAVDCCAVCCHDE